MRKRPNADAAGQSGDDQGLATHPAADSESVTELLDEGNAYEASIISGVENVPDADRAEVTTHQSPQDDVPEEYQNPER